MRCTTHPLRKSQKNCNTYNTFYYKNPLLEIIGLQKVKNSLPSDFWQNSQEKE